jgi:hypothetical protein
MTVAKKLIVESPFYEFDIVKEAVNRNDNPRYYIRGPYMEHSKANKNKRIYLENEMREDVQRFNTEMINTGRAGGELSHSPDPDIKLERMCHKILELIPEKNLYIGKSMVLSTPNGKILESLINDGVQFGMSTKSLGNIVESEGSDIQEVNGFYLVGVDAVYDPSCSSAFVNGILENKEFIVTTDGKFEESYDRLEKGLSKYPSKYRDDINNHIKTLVESFLRDIK